jgi:hypothetical protein
LGNRLEGNQSSEYHDCFSFTTFYGLGMEYWGWQSSSCEETQGLLFGSRQFPSRFGNGGGIQSQANALVETNELLLDLFSDVFISGKSTHCLYAAVTFFLFVFFFFFFFPLYCAAWVWLVCMFSGSLALYTLTL